jgi:hypothetical protein
MDSQDLLPQMLSMLFGIALYVYMGYSLMTIANKTKTPNNWFAWIPILNVFLMIKIAGKSYWWILLFFVPLANIIALIMLWMEIAKRCNKPAWVGVLMIVPFANFVVPGYLAFSK